MFEADVKSTVQICKQVRSSDWVSRPKCLKLMSSLLSRYVNKLDQVTGSSNTTPPPPSPPPRPPHLTLLPSPFPPPLPTSPTTHFLCSSSSSSFLLSQQSSPVISCSIQCVAPPPVGSIKELQHWPKCSITQYTQNILHSIHRISQGRSCPRQANSIKC